ncbi:hypothetical protein [Heyndrickxia camelliae]|uniref:Uncharacterized protein n=1 Tax=Heyndrickxia camelliae TaxID=1707093 RepID=A0A2N3LI39_9BACI|nr:hypothetical protein [Heyndrickxia camelliae]PKR84193.1 hypothetical protein CWO92_15430 [Heyndrickxia camelliae]
MKTGIRIEKKEEQSNYSLSSVGATDIKAFIDNAKNKRNGKILTVNGNRLIIRYDKASGQIWIDVTNENGEGVILRQQSSHIEMNEVSGYYMLVECTHQWQYSLFPLERK